MVSTIVTIALIVLSVVLDQVSKYLVVANMELGQSIDIISGVFRFTYIHNEGAAFGSMADARWIFMILSSVAIIAILVYIFWKKPQSKLLLAALILVAGGGIGNMIDRIWLGYVIDFIDFCALPGLWMWVFNVADSCITIGAGLMALWLVIDMFKEMKKEKSKKLAEAAIQSSKDPDNQKNGDSDE